MPLSRHALVFVAALALMGAGVAAPVRAPAPLYPGAGAAWAGPLGGALRSPALVSSLTPGLATLDLTTPAGLRASAPLVAQLQSSLGYTPATFRDLSAADRETAVQLAAEAAREELRGKVFELADRARALAGRQNLDKEARAELYAVVAHLTELRDHYRGFLDDRMMADTEGAYALAAGKAWAVRRALLGELTGNTAALDEPAAPAAPRPVLRKPSSKAVKLRARMQATRTGWGQDDFRALYLGYGFEERQGSDHRFYTHPVFPQLHDSVGRHNELATGYAHGALKILEEYDRLTAPAAPATRLAAAHDGPPAVFSLELISVLLSPPSAKTALAASVAPEAVLSGIRDAAAPRAPPAAARLRPATPRAERVSRE
ncbi:MAG: hypothetical protein SF051_15245, partial [Elusimicrobiota bacterium]|nr:hypothetical protein [Elusimicrobiota bacterium]